ncbi:MAG: hypothetical protein PHV20_09850 [Bacteroidales bacterium]|nr:hypothetical protein [Bacteroidales bacterium]
MENEHFDNLEDSLNDLNLDNQVKKLKLETEFGAHFGDFENNLDPAIEGAFLDSILAFERNFKNSTRTTLFNRLEKPQFPASVDLSDEEVSEALTRVLQLLNQHNVRLDTICPVDNRTLYAFIVEELFYEEMDDMQVPGMQTCFIYEEFHPNHEYDIRSHSEDFFRLYLDKSSDYYSRFLTSAAEKKDWHTIFRELFVGFDLKEFSITSIAFDQDCGVATFSCDFEGRMDGNLEFVNFRGDGEIKLVQEYDYWCVDSILLPKVKQ